MLHHTFQNLYSLKGTELRFKYLTKVLHSVSRHQVLSILIDLNLFSNCHYLINILYIIISLWLSVSILLYASIGISRTHSLQASKSFLYIGNLFSWPSFETWCSRISLWRFLYNDHSTGQHMAAASSWFRAFNKARTIKMTISSQNWCFPSCELSTRKGQLKEHLSQI